MSLPSAAPKKREHVAAECSDVLSLEELCSPKEKRAKTSDEEGMKLYNIFDIQESALDQDFVRDDNDWMFDQNLFTSIIDVDPLINPTLFQNDLSNNSLQEIFNNIQTSSPSHNFNTFPKFQPPHDIQSPHYTSTSQLLSLDQILKNAPRRPSTLKLTKNQFNINAPLEHQIFTSYQHNEDIKLPMMQSFLKKVPNQSPPSPEIFTSSNLSYPSNINQYNAFNNQYISTIDQNFQTPPSNMITIEPKTCASPDTTYSPTKPNFLQSYKPFDNQYYPSNSDYEIPLCNYMQFSQEDFKANVFDAANNEISAVEKKPPNYILQALMDKIKRNQIKNQTNNDVNIDSKKDSRSKNSDLSNSERIINQLENKTLENKPPSKSSKTKVILGEADTSNGMYICDFEGKYDIIHNSRTSPSFKNASYFDSFLFHLNAPISLVKKPDKDLRITYLNKGQYYVLSLECLSGKLKTNQAILKTVVMVLFQDNSFIIGNELSAWKTWHNKQQSFRQRILDVDFKNGSKGRPLDIIELAFNATSVVWKADCSNVLVNTAVNCLSTDFSNQKGVKGIPLIMQLDTYLDDNLIQRAQCHIKVFCDKGAERKVRDEERKNKDLKIYPDDNLNSPTSSVSTNFHPFHDLTKTPALFNPKPNIPIKTKSSHALDSIFKNESLKIDNKSDKITLFVKEDQELAYNELLLENPTVESLLKAIASKYNLKQECIKNLYKKSKKGILVKVDDQVIRHYANESTYIIRTEESKNPSMLDVTLQEIEIEK